MNETDKMLADMLASFEKDKKTVDGTTQKTKNLEPQRNSEIDSMLNDLKKSINLIYDDFVLIEAGDSRRYNNFYICKHQVTQKEFFDVMGINPSYFQMDNKQLTETQMDELKKLQTTKNNPVECVSWFDAIYYCNKKSILEGLTPVYSINRFTDVRKWCYSPCMKRTIHNEISVSTTADGYRLPTKREWRIAAGVGDKSINAGSVQLKDESWYFKNSGKITHPVMQKKENLNGLFDMSGNVSEWCWEEDTYGNLGLQYNLGGGYSSRGDVSKLNRDLCYEQLNTIGFRVVLLQIK